MNEHLFLTYFIKNKKTLVHFNFFYSLFKTDIYKLFIHYIFYYY